MHNAPWLSFGRTAPSPLARLFSLLTPLSFPNRERRHSRVGTVSAFFRSSFSCLSSALVASTSFAFAIRLENVVRSAAFLFGVAFAFHCLPACLDSNEDFYIPETRMPLASAVLGAASLDIEVWISKSLGSSCKFPPVENLRND